jgi:hypothetical protein
MHRHAFSFTGFVLLLSLATTPVQAQKSADPLRLVPDVADFVAKVEQPRQLIDLAMKAATMKELQGFNAYREFYNSTNYRRGVQLIGYFEKQLGKSWPELVEQLAGGGAVVAAKIEKDNQNPPYLVVIQGKDAELARKFVNLALEVAEQELARQDVKERPRRESHSGVEVIRFGDQFHAALLGSTLVFSNAAKDLEAAIDLSRDSAKSLLHSEKLAGVRKLLPAQALAWAWVNFEQFKQNEEFKNVYELPNVFFPFHVIAGGMLDVIKRSNYVAAALTHENGETNLTIRMPAGREGLGEIAAAHVPPAGEPGLLPLLQPKGVLYSTSFYLDIPKFWEKRAALLPSDQLKDIENFEKDSGRFLFGNRVGQLLSEMGARHRVVVARQYETGYSSVPDQRIPAFALVMQVRDPDKFAKMSEPPLRAAGLLAGFAVKMKFFEEKHAEAKIIGYRFAEEQKKDGVDIALAKFLLNYSPSFVRVGDQFVFCSTLELARNLVDELKKESAGERLPTDVALKGQFYWAGLASFLEAIRPQLITGSILNEGNTPEEAKQQVELLLELLGKLGGVENRIRYEANQYHYDLRILTGTVK